MNSEEMSQRTAVERAWKAAATAQEYAERESFSNVLMWSEVARSWAAVAGQLEYVTVTVERDARDLPDDDCLRLTERAEYCPAAGSPRCVSCVWRPADDAPDKAGYGALNLHQEWHLAHGGEMVPTCGYCVGELKMPEVWADVHHDSADEAPAHECPPDGQTCSYPLDEPTELVPTVLPLRDPGATLVMPVLCHCASQPHAHPYAAGCRQ